MDKKNQDDYRTLTIQAAKNGWIVMQSRRVTEVYIRWESLILRLEEELASKNSQGKGGEKP